MSTSWVAHLVKHTWTDAEGNELPFGPATPATNVVKASTSILQALQQSSPAMDLAENTLTYMVRANLSMRMAADKQAEVFKTGPISRRHIVSERLLPLANKWLTAAMNTAKHLALKKKLPLVGTLAIDVGTNQKRYLAYVVIIGGRAVFYDMTYDADVGGRFTIQEVRKDVVKRMAELEARHGIKVVAVVADNASNMQGIAVKHDTDEPDSDELKAIPILIRCACHALQLVVHKLRPLWNVAFEAAEQAVQAANVRVSANETRWSSSFNVIVAALDRAAEHLNEDMIRECHGAVELLAPFWQTTDFLQGDKATLKDAFTAFESLRVHFDELAAAQNDSALGRARQSAFLEASAELQKRLEIHCNRPFVIVALLAPCVCAVDYLEAFEETVKTLALVDPNIAAELHTVMEMPFARQDSCTWAQYEEHIDQCVSIYCPKLATFIRGLLNASPSEAAVERLFSLLGRQLTKLQNQTKSTTVVAKLRVAAGYAFFHPSAFADSGSDDDEDEELPEPPRSRSTTETPARPITVSEEMPSPAAREPAARSRKQLRTLRKNLYQ
jgi:hypothetical protein